LARVISLAAASAEKYSPRHSPPAQIVDAEQAARQHHGTLVPQQLQAMRDGGQARAVQDHDRRKARGDQRHADA
jgi:hypothetical protein